MPEITPNRALSSSMTQRLAAYSAGVAAMAVGASSANALVMYTDLGPGGQSTGAGGSVGIDFNNDSTDEFYISHSVSSSKVNLNHLNQPLGRGHLEGPDQDPAALLAGDMIGASAVWDSLETPDSIFKVGNSTYGNFTTSETRYLGLRFKLTGLESDFYYGWAALSVDQSNAQTTVLGYAYESNNGQKIIAGDTGDSAVPEPSSVALLALGGIGLAMTRRRRRHIEA